MIDTCSGWYPFLQPGFGAKEEEKDRVCRIFLRLLILGWKMLGGRQRQAKEQREASRRKIPAVVCGFVAFAASLATLIDCELRGLDAVRAVGEALSPLCTIC